MAKQENYFKVQGFIHRIYPLKEFPSKQKGKKNFSKREFVLETRDEGKDGFTYKNLNKFEMINSFVEALDNLGVNSEVVVHFALAGKEWTKEGEKEPICINALRCWRIDIIENTNQDIKYTEKQVISAEESQDYSEDLPF